METSALDVGSFFSFIAPCFSLSLSLLSVNTTYTKLDVYHLPFDTTIPTKVKTGDCLP